MKTQLLKSFIAILIFNAAILISANAQIVYHDINPDITHTCTGNSCSQAYNLDLNNDSITDYIITSYHHVYYSPPVYIPVSYVNILPQSNNLFASTSLSTVKMFSQFDGIGTTLIWHGATGQYFKYIMANQNQGEWNNAVDKYVGLKLMVGGQFYYGWARLNVNVTSASATFTIKDYTYNTIPNQQILAGQTCSPQAAIKANGPLSFCSGDSVVLTSKNSGNTLKYQWKKNNANISGATNKSYTVTAAGDYKVKVTDTINNCHKTSGIKTITVPCRNSNENIVERLEHLSVYPNPATNSVTIKIPSDEAGEIQIINLFGRVVETHNYASLRDGELHIDVSKFPAGMYVVRWSSGENYETKTFSVIK